MTTLSKDILFCIFDYMLDIPYKLLDWIEPHKHKLDPIVLSSNTSNGIAPILRQYINTNPDKLCWWRLSSNENHNVMKLIEELLDKSFDDYFNRLDWELICKNKAAIPIIEKYIHLVDWYYQ